MSNKPIRMTKVKQILQWHSEGVDKKKIALRARVNRNTVRSYIRQYISMNRPMKELLAMPDQELEEQFAAKPVYEPDERMKALTELFLEMEKKIKKGWTRHRLWEEYREDHPDGYGLTQFKVIYRLWAQYINATMHIEHKAGDKMYVDFAGDKFLLTDPQTGEVVKVEVFVAILGSSQLTYVEAVMNRQKENFIRACENALHYFGGVPQAIGEDTRAYIIEILGKRQHPEKAYRTCQGILSLSARASQERLNAACRRANHFGDYSYKTIVTILQKRLETEPLEREQDKPVMPIHMKIRGGSYYA